MYLSLACVRSLVSFPLLLALTTDIEQAVSHITFIPMHTLILGVPHICTCTHNHRTRARARACSLASPLSLTFFLSRCLSVSLSLYLAI